MARKWNSIHYIKRVVARANGRGTTDTNVDAATRLTTVLCDLYTRYTALNELLRARDDSCLEVLLPDRCDRTGKVLTLHCTVANNNYLIQQLTCAHLQVVARLSGHDRQNLCVVTQVADPNLI